MKYLLDTNVLSAVMQGNPAVNARLAAVGRHEVSVSQPTLAEIAYGIARLPDSKRRRWLHDSHTLMVATLPRAEWSDKVSESFGAIKATLEKRGERIEDFDIAIAAHALASNLVLVTADRKHMLRIPGLVAEDWSK